MIGTGIDVRVKIQDIVSSQLPEFILSEAPLTDDFLKQFYVSQEFQGGSIDFATNLDQYLDLNNLSSDSLYGTFELTQAVSAEDTEVYVNTTKSFPNEWGLLKVNDEIMTYKVWGIFYWENFFISPVYHILFTISLTLIT